MEVIRDEIWQKCLTDATKMYRLSEPNDACYNLADATWKCKMSYKLHEKKKNERQIIVLDKPPETINVQRNARKLCAATTMTGKPCSFKAVCGEFCKKHRIDKNEIGVKIKSTCSTEQC
tara:strand:+ start:848 stop:1204 length:357 start_codon:yes stop_codon:yes gene_type:complete